MAKRKKVLERRAPDIREVVRHLMLTVRSPVRLLELYYWSRERPLSDLMRAFVMLPPKTRELLLAFLEISGDPQHIEATVDSEGRMTLYSPRFKEMRAIMAHADSIIADGGQQTH